MARAQVGIVALALAFAAGVWSSADAASVQPTRLACYGGQFSSFTARKLSLVDRVAGKLTVLAYIPEEVCASATSSRSYLTCYRMRVATRFTSKRMRSSDEFRAFGTLVVSRPSALCITSARVDEGGSSTASKAFDLLTCYSAAPTTAVARGGVTIADEFGKSDDSISGPARVCSPAARAPGPVPAFGQPLACYTVKSMTKGKSVVVRNTFGFLKAALGPRGRLCVAATLS
jgi:hypothetical protein